MVGIGIDHISITRRLPIEAAVLGQVLARLRAETSGTSLCWTLGERGSCELDVTFGGRASSAEIAFVASARLWDPEHAEFAPISVSLVACGAHETLLELHPVAVTGEWWSARVSAYLDLAQAAVEELAQELLFQHARVRQELAS